MTMKISTMSTRPMTVSLVLVSMAGSKCEGVICPLVAADDGLDRRVGPP
jgi:hypothetical protein